MTLKKTSANKRTLLPRATDYTKTFLKDWERLLHSGRSGTCASPGRMIRPDDFFVQTFAAPDIKAYAEGKTFDRTIDPLRTTYSNDASTNLILQNSRAAFKAKMEEILNRRYVAPTPVQ